MPRPVDLDAIRPQDVVLVSTGGRVFHATVSGRGVGGFSIEPHDRTVRARHARPGELVDHWLHAERAQAIPDGQLSLEELTG
jgi:hypothetical protein